MEECFGCWQEARRADKVASLLLTLRTSLPEYYENISAVLREVESASRLLRDLYDLFPIYRARVPMVRYYLNVILPTFQKTLLDMLNYVDNGELPARTQWTLMGQRLGEQGGMTLAQRFGMYCEALVQTVRLLSRCGIFLFLIFLFCFWFWLLFFSRGEDGIEVYDWFESHCQQIPIIRSHLTRAVARPTHAIEEAATHSRYIHTTSTILSNP